MSSNIEQLRGLIGICIHDADLDDRCDQLDTLLEHHATLAAILAEMEADKAKIKSLEEEDENNYRLCTRQAEILDGVALALKGTPPEEGMKWSHHDLAAMAREQQARIAKLEAVARDAGKSLNSIATLSGKDELMLDISQIKAFARNRSIVVDDALSKSEANQ